jgi:DNA processing protein
MTASCHDAVPDAVRSHYEALVEAFVSTPGLGASRLRSAQRHSELGLGETLECLSLGDASPFRSPRRRGEGWDQLAARFHDVCRSGVGEAGCRWWLPGDPGWSAVFGTDDDPPAALAYTGSLDALLRPRVAVVGTRSASAAGLAFARELGAALSSAGVAVVSGLARGIDGAAHRGTLGSNGEGRAIGVLGTGLGVAYPREHRDLQRNVAACGLLLTEDEPPRGPRPEAFPRRNRIVAQVAQVVVVVESGERGGSLLTVQEATMRGRPILAVPNNPLLRSAAGSNGLLRPLEGTPPVALPCHGPADVLAVLDVEAIVHAPDDDPRTEPDERSRTVLDALGWDERATSWLAAAVAMPLGEMARVLASLEDGGWIAHRSGRWHRRPR